MTAKENELKKLKEENEKSKQDTAQDAGKVETPCDCEDSPSMELPQRNAKDQKVGDKRLTEKRTSNDSGALAGPNTKPTVRPAADSQEDRKKEKEEDDD